MKILTESFQDVEIYLRSSDLMNKIVSAYGEKFYEDYESSEITTFVEETVIDMFNDYKIASERVAICKITGDDIDLVDSMHSVINYNGSYYDYCAQKFSDSFGGLLGSASIPVVQKVVHTDKQLTDKISTVKGYTILGY